MGHKGIEGRATFCGIIRPEYQAWKSMLARCLNPNHDAWLRYGGCGVEVHQAWAVSFSAFLADMGERPEGTSLDRIDPRGNYAPDNCRWATPLEQRHNRRKAAA